MAHLVENGVVNDGSWSLSVLVTDMNIQRTLFVTGQLHIGGLMLKLVDEIGQLYIPTSKKKKKRMQNITSMVLTAKCLTYANF